MQRLDSGFDSEQTNQYGPAYERNIDITIGYDPNYAPSPRKSNIPWTNILLFILTIISTVFAGTLLEGKDPFASVANLYWGIPFALTLMGILTFHEFGHYLMARYHGLKATFPYFIPFPLSPVGTFGAIIKIKSPILNKRALMDVGAAGPIAGFLVSLPALYFGLQASDVQRVGGGEGAFLLGNSILMQFMQYIIFGDLPPGFDIYLNSVAFAGWFGLLVTAFNLLPLGQLDGGHILYALAGRRQFPIARVLLLVLIVLGFGWNGWWLWAGLAFIMKIKHPPTMDEFVALDTRRKIIGILCLGIFILCFVPVPFQIQ